MYTGSCSQLAARVTSIDHWWRRWIGIQVWVLGHCSPLASRGGVGGSLNERHCKLKCDLLMSLFSLHQISKYYTLDFEFASVTTSHASLPRQSSAIALAGLTVVGPAGKFMKISTHSSAPCDSLSRSPDPEWTAEVWQTRGALWVKCVIWPGWWGFAPKL